MMKTVKLNINRQDPEVYDKLRLALILDLFGEYNAESALLNRDEGQVIARIDEIENFIEPRLAQIREMRSKCRERRQHLRDIEVKLHAAINGKRSTTEAEVTTKSIAMPVIRS